MTFATVRGAAQEAAKAGALTSHQLAALGRLDELLTDEQRQAFTELWRAVGSPAAKPGKPATGSRPAVSEWRTVINGLKLSQPDAVTCQATCIAMAVGDKDIQGIRRKLTAIGTAGDPAVMGRVIRSYGVPYRYEGDACLEDVYGWLKAGEFLITHGWFTGAGHVICLDGLRQVPRSSRYELNVADPWGEFDFPTWKYLPTVKFFDGFYSELGIYASCVAGASATDASRIYRAGEVDRTRRGMWVHRFQAA